MTLRRRETLTGLAYAALPLAGFAAFFAAPFGVMILMTFTGGAGRGYVGLRNYADVLDSPAFRMAAGNTFRFIAVGVPSVMAAALLISLLLNRGLRWSGFFRSACVLPLVVPVASVPLFFRSLFERGGAVNHGLSFLGLPNLDFLRSGGVFFVLILLYVWKNVGYNVILITAGLQSIPGECLDAARVDGAGPWRRLFFVTLPLLSPTLFFTVVISLINAFKSFREAYVLGGDYPHESIYMLQHYLNNSFGSLSYQRLSVAALLTFAAVSLLLLALFLWRKRAGEWW